MVSRTKTLHFTLGPVQGFVAQARRTRDLWAGSYLLSYLAGFAMKASKESRCEIVIPDVKNDLLYQAIAAGKKPGQTDDASQVGSLPNRFKAEVPDGVDGKVCVEAIAKKWGDIANEVRTELNKLLDTAKVDPKIWHRQIDHHWDCAWVISDDDSVLDIRKNLRNHHPPPEPGEKCTVCGERQELSGLGMGSGKSRKEMGEWWGKVRVAVFDTEEGGKVKGATLFDLKKNERLCAVCLVKRAFVFPDIAKQVVGWKVPVNYPSTSYMAAVDWIIRVFQECGNQNVSDQVHSFVSAAEEAKVWFSERTTQIKEIEETAKSIPALQTKVKVTSDAERKIYVPLWEAFASLDGDAFFKSAINNPRDFEVDGDSERTDPCWVEKSRENPKRKALEDALKALQDVLQQQSGKSRKATPFYALLLMDGDGMGKLLSTHKDKQGGISEALAQFTKTVPDIVEDCNGRLIYAGADDVFALMPLNKAIECARLCRQAYMQAFNDQFGGPRNPGAQVPKEYETTISAAIEYSHMQTALGVVVKDAHRLLDGVAKDRCGRDGLACRVWKRGGPVLTWAQPWEHVLKVDTSASGKTHPTLIDQVKYDFQDASDDAGKFSSKFFYKLRDLFELLTGEDGRLSLKEDEAQRILVTEYLANREIKDPKDKPKQREEAEKRVARLLTLCQAHKRFDNGQLIPTGAYGADGALLIRFLVQKQV